MKLSFWSQSHSCSKSAFRTVFLISFLSHWNFLPWHQHAVIVTFWEALKHTIDMPLKQKGQRLATTGMSQNFQQTPSCPYGKLREGKALLWFWTVFSTSALPLVKLCIALDLCDSPITLVKVFLLGSRQKLSPRFHE